MRWRVKGLVQKTLSVVPGGVRANDALQRAVGAFRRFDDEADGKIEDFRLMASQLATVGVRVDGAVLLEIGTGWYPTLPVCLYLAGARRVVTFDLVRHLQPDLALRLVRKLHDRTRAIAAAAGADEAAVDERRADLESRLARGAPLDVASDGVIDYRAPADAAHTGLADGSVDIVFSNSVLEHVPPVVLDGLFAEGRRVLRTGGVAFHSVNCGDHYAYTDPSVGQLHYLQFPDRVWKRWWNNDLQYQNRLRAIDFIELAKRHDLEIVRDTRHATPERLEELRRLPRIADEFAGYAPEELCITTVDFVARRPT